MDLEKQKFQPYSQTQTDRKPIMGMVILQTVSDLRTWVEGQIDDYATVEDINTATDAIQAMDHPAWGSDWREFLESIELATHRPIRKVENKCHGTAIHNGMCVACGREISRNVAHNPNVTGSLGYTATWSDGSTAQMNR